MNGKSGVILIIQLYSLNNMLYVVFYFREKGIKAGQFV